MAPGLHGPGAVAFRRGNAGSRGSGSALPCRAAGLLTHVAALVAKASGYELSLSRRQNRPSRRQHSEAVGRETLTVLSAPAPTGAELCREWQGLAPKGVGAGECPPEVVVVEVRVHHQVDRLRLALGFWVAGLGVTGPVKRR